MNDGTEEPATRYVAVESDRYEADRDAFVFQKTSIVGPDQATRWAERLKLTIDDLTGFPGPLAHARDEEASMVYGRDVRRLLYHGPSRRRSKQPVRILFSSRPEHSHLKRGGSAAIRAGFRPSCPAAASRAAASA